MLTWLTAEIDGRPLGLARIVVGAAAVIRAFFAMAVMSRLTHSEILKAPYADWLPDPTTIGVWTAFVVWLVAGTAFMLGYRVALSGTALLGAIVYTLALDQQTYSNHLYLMAWLVLLMILAKAGTSLSITSRSGVVVRWPVLLIMAQASIVYGFSAVTKLNPDFLSGRVLASIIHGGLIPFPEQLRTPTVLSVMAMMVVTIELFVAISLWNRSFRPAAFALGLALHAGITLLMESTGELFVFSLEMLALYPLFLEQRRLRLEWNPSCAACAALVSRMRRFDVLGMVDWSEREEPGFGLRHSGEVTSGFAALVTVWEHLVPWLWVAPLLRFPGVARIGDRVLHARTERAGSTVG